VVRRLVEDGQRGLFDQKPGQCDPSPLSAAELFDRTKNLTHSELLEEHVDLATPFPTTKPLDFVRAGGLLAEQLFPSRLLRGDTLTQRFMGSERVCPRSETVEHDVASGAFHRQVGFL
jgi:hypothetical protein